MKALSPALAALRIQRCTRLVWLVASMTSVTVVMQVEAAEPRDSGAVLEEITVTATRRKELLIDTPQSVTVMSAADLDKLGATQFRDFANTVPGLAFTTAGAGFTQVSLRGVTTGVDIAPTVGIYLDEVPYGSSVTHGVGTRLALDVGLFDLARVEVLRGPQGTLYGASTMGGLIRYVTNQPQTDSLSVQTQLGISDTHEGDLNYNGSATFNLPLVTDKAGLRATAFYSRDGGYIDNVETGREDVNGSDVYGGRADILLTPNDSLSIRLSGFVQNIARDGESNADYTRAGTAIEGALDQRRFVAEPFDQRFRLGSATVSFDLGGATVTSISSYQTVRSAWVTDLVAFAPLCGIFGENCASIGYPARVTTDKFTQEIRIVSEGDSALQWLFGGFYTNEDSEGVEGFIPYDANGQQVDLDLFSFRTPSSYEEYAAFGDLTWKLTSKFDITGGVRFAHNKQEFEQIGGGAFGFSTTSRESKDDVFTYLANARYQFTDHATAYLRYATAYRPGGPNVFTVDPGTGLPVGQPTYESDRLKSYELGTKVESEDGRLAAEVAVYHIDWSNMQVGVMRGGFGAIANAEDGADITGGELAFSARPGSAFSLAGTLAYQDARMAADNPDLNAVKDERLPNVPRVTATLSADLKLPIGAMQPTVGATVRYVDERMATLGESLATPPYRLPDYTTVDLRTRFGLGAVDVQFYVRNVFDERGQVSVILPAFGDRVGILQPRTIGITASTAF